MEKSTALYLINNDDSIELLNQKNQQTKEKFIKDCVNTVSAIDVKSEAEAIAKETVLSTLEELIKDKKDLIKYLEDKITYRKEIIKSNDLWEDDDLELTIYQDILERVESGKYD